MIICTAYQGNKREMCVDMRSKEYSSKNLTGCNVQGWGGDDVDDGQGDDTGPRMRKNIVTQVGLCKVARDSCKRQLKFLPRDSSPPMRGNRIAFIEFHSSWYFVDTEVSIDLERFTGGDRFYLKYSKVAITRPSFHINIAYFNQL